MAVVAAMMASAGTGRTLNLLSSSASVIGSRLSSSLSTRRVIQIRCMAEPGKSAEESSADPTLAPSVTPIATEPAVPRTRKVSTKFEDIFAFSGPAPEIINGRLAMLGFVGSLAVEFGTGNSFTNQLQSGGLGLGLFTAALFTAASLIPMFQGVTAESKSKNFWSSDAEKLNGRLAMVGLVALAITEYVKGTPLV